MDEKCASCGSAPDRRYLPMREWNMKGPLCGGCYSKLIAEFYPGDHARMGSRRDGGGGEDAKPEGKVGVGGRPDTPRPQEAAPGGGGAGSGSP